MRVLYPSYRHGGPGRIMDYSVYTHKVCSKCKGILPVGDFQKIKKNSGIGWCYRSQCRECRKPYVRRYSREYQRKQRRAKGIPERVIHKTEQERQAAYRRASRRHYRRHLEQERQRTAKWRKENPEKQRFMEKRRKWRKAGAKGSHTYDEWLEIKKAYGNLCVYCQRSEPGIELTQDHIIPLNKGGTDDAGNIQPLCFSCNAAKQDKIEDRAETCFLRFGGPNLSDQVLTFLASRRKYMVQQSDQLELFD